MARITVWDDQGEVVYAREGELEGVLRELCRDGTLGAGSPGRATGGLPPGVRAPVLTENQREVLQSLACSLSPDQAALRLGISEASVRQYITRLKHKFKADSRDQLMAMAGYLGLCNPYAGSRWETGPRGELRWMGYT